jgi:hypothetical protein
MELCGLRGVSRQTALLARMPIHRILEFALSESKSAMAEQREFLLLYGEHSLRRQPDDSH